jgi:hypothetical protein
MQRWIFLGILVVLPSLLYSQNSVLSSGSWHKIGITQDGIYKIDFSMLQELGLDPSTIDPDNLQIFGNAVNGTLPQSTEVSRPEDLTENAIKGYGLEDGIFNSEDYFLFYGKGPDRLEWGSDQWIFEKNIYADTSYYFLTVGDVAGKRLMTSENLGDTLHVVDEYMEVITHELDEKNIIESGRKWYGNEMSSSSGLSTSFVFETPDALDSMFINVQLMARTDRKTAFNIKVNNFLLESLDVDSVNIDEGSTYDIKGRETSGFFGFRSLSSITTIDVELVDPGSSTLLIGYIDRLIFSYNRQLKYAGIPLTFTSPTSLEEQVASFQLISGNNLDVEIWDITDPTDTKLQDAQKEPDQVVFGTTTEFLKTFIAFEPTGNFPQPIIFGPVTNQNLRSKAPKDGLIVTAPELVVEANQLAEFHRQHSQLDVEVATTRQIYNEFSSGRQDVTAIRDAIRFYWNKNPETFRYTLLFGDCSYDYKDRIRDNTNLVPVYQSVNSLDPVATYSSEDFFGFMEDGEGSWSEGPRPINHTLEIGVGRLPVKNRQEARNMVQKIIGYATNNENYGEWKSRVAYVVDDGDNNTHVDDAEGLARYLNRFHGEINLNKLYLDRYEQKVEGRTETVPGLELDLRQTINDGAFLINYLGHGSEARWAQETVLDFNEIENLTNRDRLPVFLTATCEFGRYDDPLVELTGSISGAESLLLNPNGGGIALLTTTRPVFAFSNEFVNSAFHEHFFNAELRLGDIVRFTKNASLSGVRNRNFSLLGDPMLKLAYPQFDIKISEINGKDMSNDALDTLSALEHVSLVGHVTKINGEIATEFNGEAFIQVFDRQQEKRTIGQESVPFTYLVQENQIFQGTVSVVNGEFNAAFILPKNITYRYDPGKITVFAIDEVNKSDASGFLGNIVIGGSEEQPDIESNPPEVDVYLNDRAFIDGDIVGRNSIFYAQISDQSGINMTGLGISQDIELVLNDTLRFELNNYYSADIDSYQSGLVRFPLNDLPEGEYLGELSVWDIHNNLSIKTVQFIVSDDPLIRLYNLTSYPNPTRNRFNIAFEHDRIGETLDVGLVFYDMNGRVLAEEKFDIRNSPTRIEEIQIDLQDFDLEPGIFIYRIQVVSSFDNAKGILTGRCLIMK